MEITGDLILQYIVNAAIKVIAALIIFAIGRWLAGLSARYVGKALKRGDYDEALVRFLTNLTKLSVVALAIVIALGTLGVESTSYAALIAAFGLAVGLALQGALSNFAAGVLILVTHPFTLNQVVEIAGKTGLVDDIGILSTKLITGDNKVVVVPNGQIMDGTITNYSELGVRRIDLVFGIGYGDDLLKAKQLLLELLQKDERVLEDPAPTVKVLELAHSSVNFAVRPFVKIEDYWDAHFDLTEKVKLRFDEAGISIPYQQQDIHVFQANGNAS